MTRLQRMSSVAAWSSGETLARMNSGPIVNSGFGRAARKTWARAGPAPASRSSAARPPTRSALDRDRRELAREVLLERELLLDHSVLQQRVLHDRERRDVDATVDGQERSGDPVGGQHRLGRPRELLRAEQGRLLRVLTHEPHGPEHRAHALPDLLGVLPDRLLGRVLDLADPLAGDRVEAQEHLRLAPELGDRAAVAPHVVRDLPARHRGQLAVEAAEADDLDVPVRVP